MRPEAHQVKLKTIGGLANHKRDTSSIHIEYLDTTISNTALPERVLIII